MTTDSTSEPHGARTSEGPPVVPDGKSKFHLASELNQTVTMEAVGRKVMDAPIQLRMCELLTVSSEVSNYIHEQMRKRRVSIVPESGIAANRIIPAMEDSTERVILANVDSAAIAKSLYACPSAHATVSLNDKLQVKALLDDGSELNIMAKCPFDQLQHPIDTNIN